MSSTVTRSVQTEILSQVEVAQRSLSNLLEMHGGTPVVIDRTLHFGGWIANSDIVLVDQVKAITGCDATIYQIVNGTPTAISTTLQSGGNRIIGSTLTGAPLAAIMHKEPYRGSVPFNGLQYVAVYEPIIDDSGQLIGTLFTAKPATALAEAATLTVLRVAGISLVAFVVIIILVLAVLRNIRRDAFSVATVARALANGILDDTAEV
ncbi:MAG: Cache 3/Cache 2 fusion domain-containing protein, partial [Vulcanimicrobiaceae bacterium]